MTKLTRVWLSPRHAKGPPEPLDLIEKPKGNVLRGANGWTYFNWHIEGETWHRKHSDAIKAARRHRAAWLAEVTAKAAEIAALPPLEDA